MAMMIMMIMMIIIMMIVLPGNDGLGVYSKSSISSVTISLQKKLIIIIIMVIRRS